MNWCAWDSHIGYRQLKARPLKVQPWGIGGPGPVHIEGTVGLA